MPDCTKEDALKKAKEVFNTALVEGDSLALFRFHNDGLETVNYQISTLYQYHIVNTILEDNPAMLAALLKKHFGLFGKMAA